MKFLVEVTMPARIVNAFIKDGTLPVKLQQIMDKLKPEAAYFGIRHGQRTMFFVTDLPSADKMPVAFEPLWIVLEADVTVTPVMTKADLEKGLKEFAKEK